MDDSRCRLLVIPVVSQNAERDTRNRISTALARILGMALTDCSG